MIAYNETSVTEKFHVESIFRFKDMLDQSYYIECGKSTGIIPVTDPS